MKVYLIRHTSVIFGRETCYGQKDVDVAGTFQEEAAVLKDKLRDIEPPDICYCSPLKRCTMLADEIYSGKPVIDPRLLEMDFGRWELQKWSEIGQEDMADWINDFVNVPAPGGESFSKLIERSISFWNDIIGHYYNSCLVISHSGVIHALIAHVLGMPGEKSFSFNIDYGSITSVSVSRHRTVVEFVNR